MLARQSSHSNSRSISIMFDLGWDGTRISFYPLRGRLDIAEVINPTLNPLYIRIP